MTKRRRVLLAVAVAVVVVLGGGFAVLRLALEGPPLGSKIASILNKRMRGRIEIGSVEWPASALETVVAGGWIPVTIRDVKVWDDCALSGGDTDLERRATDPNQDCTPDDQPDPDPSSNKRPRRLVLVTPLVTAELDAHAILFGNHDFVFRHIRVHGGRALIEQTREPYPLHAYDRTIVTIVTAFYPRLKPGFRAGIYADKPPPIFDLRDFHVEDLDLTVHVAPYGASKAGDVAYGMTAHIEGVAVDAAPVEKDDSYLTMNATDPLVAKFYVRLALHGKHGDVRIMDEGPRTAFHIGGERDAGRKAKYRLELDDVVLDRLAQLPTDWARNDYVANTLELSLTAHTVPCGGASKDGARLHLGGELLDWWDHPYDGKWQLLLDAKNLGPTVQTCINDSIHGDHLDGTIALSGPYIVLPKVALDFKDVDVDIPIERGEQPLQLTLAEVHGEIDLVDDEGSIDETKALVRGGKEPGEVLLSAHFGLRPYFGSASVVIPKAIDVGRFLPERVAKGAGRFLVGKLTAAGDTEEGFELKDFDLELGRTATERGEKVHVYSLRKGHLFTKDRFDTIEITNIGIHAGQTDAKVGGTIDLHNDDNTVITIEGRYPDLGKWLNMFGVPAPPGLSAGGGAILLAQAPAQPAPVPVPVPVPAPAPAPKPTTITIHGLKNPRVAIRSSLANVPCLGAVDVDATEQNGIATITRLSTTGFGGTLVGSGQIDLRTSPQTIDRLHLEGHNLDAQKLCGLGAIAKGRIDDIEANLHGVIDPTRPALDWLDFARDTRLRAQHLDVLGFAYSNIELCINHQSAAACRRRPLVDASAQQDCIDAKQRNGACVVVSATRDAGGTLDATLAKVPSKNNRTPPRLGGEIALENVPMAVLDQLAGKGTVGGVFSTTLHLGSQPAKRGALPNLAPVATGSIDILRGWLANAFVGDSSLSVTPTELVTASGLRVAGVRLYGQMLVDRMTIDASIGTVAPYPVEVHVSGTRVELDPFVDLSKILGVQDPVSAWASGTIDLKTELAPLDKKPPKPEAWIRLSELHATLNHRGKDGRLAPITLEAVTPAPGRDAVSIYVAPTAIELACQVSPTKRTPCPTRLATPIGELDIQGGATPGHVAFTADTPIDVTTQRPRALDLSRLEPLFDNQFDTLSGSVLVHGQVTGTFATPDYELVIGLDDLQLRPVGSDTVLHVCPRVSGARDPECELRVERAGLDVRGFKIDVVEDLTHQHAQLNVKGTVALAGLVPSKWDLVVDGGVAGKLLLAIAPNLVAQASGAAQIAAGGIKLTGTGRLPLVNGALDLTPPKDATAFSVVPRGVRREVALDGGTLKIDTDSLQVIGAGASGTFRTYTLTIDNVHGKIDSIGDLQNIHGSVVIRDGAPTKADVRVDLATNIPFRIPKTIDLTLQASDIQITRDELSGRWRVGGSLAIVNGAYTVDFDLADKITPAPAKITPIKPFWDEYPAIGNADVDVSLDVRRFSVVNNVATIDFAGSDIRITGTPRELRLNGSIGVSGRGRFRIPLTRADFRNTTGSIDFAGKVADPKLDLTSIADYPDLSGQTHVITLTIAGSLEQPVWDLKTSTGYNKSQTLSLLFLGRNPEQLRRSLGDQAIGTDPTKIDPSTNPSATVYDQAIKDLAGDWVSGLVGGTVTRATGLDVFRIELGVGTVGATIGKRLVEDNVSATGKYESTVRGQTIDLTVDWRMPYHAPFITGDKLSIQGRYFQKTYNDPADQLLNIQDLRSGVVYRLFIP